MVHDLRVLADLYESMLKVRNAYLSRLTAVVKGLDDEGSIPEGFLVKYPYLRTYEMNLKDIRLEMEVALKEHPAHIFMMGIPGINRTMCCRILGLIPMTTEDNFASFSHLRSFAGIAPGKNRKVKGQKCTFCGRLKSTLHVAFGSMQKAAAICQKSQTRPNRFYPEIYASWRKIYAERHGPEGELSEKAQTEKLDKVTKIVKVKDVPTWPKYRQHLAARNKMLDVFLVHLWRSWREALSWSVRSLYVHEKLGHEMDYQALDFWSPSMSAKKIKELASPEDLRPEDPEVV